MQNAKFSLINIKYCIFVYLRYIIPHIMKAVSYLHG